MSEKTYNKCEDCRNYYRCDSAWDGDVACDGFKSDERTIFDRITASPEVLAEKLVYNKMYMIQDGILQYWVSSYFSTIIKGKSWEYESEAIAATVAKLKEVGNDR